MTFSTAQCLGSGQFAYSLDFCYVSLSFCHLLRTGYSLYSFSCFELIFRMIVELSEGEV
jgi:hypothetical protein